MSKIFGIEASLGVMGRRAKHGIDFFDFLDRDELIVT